MSENKKQETKKINIKISSLDIDKAEYQQIVLSNSNFPDKDYFKQDYYEK
jgi:hypothetical protein